MEAFVPTSALDGESKLPDADRCRADIEAIKQITLPPELGHWVEQYESVGRRDRFLWQWSLRAVDLTCLPCVDPSLRAANNENKVMGVMFDTLLDDVADQAKDAPFLERLLATSFEGRPCNLDSFSPHQKRYAEVTASVLQAVLTRAKTYPRYEEFEELLRFDHHQLLNAMRYSIVVNHTPQAMNLTEHDLYLAHNMHMMFYLTLDLMCSPSFDGRELGRVRSLIWYAQCMARAGNLVSTWEREIPERDFTSGVFAYAVEQDYVTIEQLLNGDSDELERQIRRHGCEQYFLIRWQEYRQRIRSMTDKIKSFDVTELIEGLDGLLRIHLGSRGLK